MPENKPIPDAELAELRRLHGEAQKTTWQAGAAREIYAAFPAILARLEAAEREQQRVHELANRLLDANNGLIDTIRKLDPEALCDWHDSIGGDEYLQQWLAARDAQQRREGAAEWLDAQHETWGVDEMVAEAKRLRERGE